MITYFPDDDLYEIACDHEGCPERVLAGPGLAGVKAAGLAAERVFGFARLWFGAREGEKLYCSECARAAVRARKEARFAQWWARAVQPKIDAAKAAREKERKREARRQEMIR